MKHTKGPWKVVGHKYIESDTRTIASVIELTMPSLVKQSAEIELNKANAALIASAPELLAALKSALLYIETYGGDVTASFAAGGNMEFNKQLIAKAEGKAS